METHTSQPPQDRSPDLGDSQEPAGQPPEDASGDAIQQDYPITAPTSPSANTVLPSSTPPTSLSAENHGVGAANSNDVEKSAPVPAKRKQGKVTRLWNYCGRMTSDTWILESTALTLALLCLVAIIVLISVFANQPLRTWHSYFGINTILSGLGTVMKGGVMLSTATALGQLNWIWFNRRLQPLQDFNLHDEASRGSLGAAKLLYRLNFWHTATLGCLVTLLSIFSDASIQASIQTLTRSTIEPDLASIPVCRNLTNCIPDVSVLNAALFDGIYVSSSKAVVNSVQGDCPTGECDYHSFSTLGICSSCYEDPLEVGYFVDHSGLYVDVPTWNVLDRNNTSPFSELDGVLYLFVFPTASGCQLTTYNITGLSLDNWGASPHARVPLTEYYFLSIRNSPAYLSATRDNDPFNNTAPINCTTLLSLTSENAHKYVQALRCTLSLCAQEISSRITRGRLSETIIAREVYGTLDLIDPKVDLESLHFDSTSISQSRLLSADTSSMFDLAIVLGAVFFGGSESCEVYGYPEGTLLGTEGNINLPVIIYDNPRLRFEHAAEYLSMALRTSSNERHTGTTIGTEAYFDVRWPFLLLPALMVLIGVIFVSIVVWQSTRRGVLLCKTNVLASVIHAGSYVANTLIKQDDLKRLEKISELEEWAEEQQVTLRRGWVEGVGSM